METLMQRMETQNTASDIFRDQDKVAKIAATRNILHQVKTLHTVRKVSTFKYAGWIPQEDYVSNLCEAGLIRYFGDSHYGITLKGLRFLDAFEQYERTAEQSPSADASP